MNLADLYRSQNRDTEAKIYFDRGLILQPSNAALHFSLGLWHIRNNDKKTAFKEIEKAYLLAPFDSYYTYTCAITLQQNGDGDKSLQILESYLSKYGNDPLILDALVAFYRDSDRHKKAEFYNEIKIRVFGP